jgi:hypothetical protein
LGAIVVVVEVVVAAEPATLDLEAAEHVHRQLPSLLDKIPPGAHQRPGDRTPTAAGCPTATGLRRDSSQTEYRESITLLRSRVAGDLRSALIRLALETPPAEALTVGSSGQRH